ncbi:MAG: ATP-binding protein [Planctomycetota bacterium]
MELKIRVTEKTLRVGGGRMVEVAEITLAGRMEAATLVDFRKTLSDLLAKGRKFVVLDFAGVAYISSTGLGGLVKYHEEFARAGGGMCLVRVPETADHIIGLLGLSDVLAIFDRMEDAAGFFEVKLGITPAVAVKPISSPKAVPPSRPAAAGAGGTFPKAPGGTFPTTVPPKAPVAAPLVPRAAAAAPSITGRQRMAQVRAEAISGKVMPAKSSASKTPKVLLAMPGEDDFSRLISAKIRFRSAGTAILMAADSAMAVSLAAKERPDVVVVDFLLPGYEGVCERLKMEQATGTLSVILLYPRNSNPDAVPGAQIMSNENIAEPFDLDHLVELVQSEVERHQREGAVLLHEFHIRFPSRQPEFERANEFFRKALGQSIIGKNPESALAVTAAVREAIDNACRHGNKWQDKRYVDIFFLLDQEKMTLAVKDGGTGFNWRHFVEKVRTTRASELARQRPVDNPGGLGIALMISCMDRVVYNDIGNIITLTKLVRFAAPTAVPVARS